MAYDVFGNGKTAIKANLSKYWQSANNEGNYTTANRAATFAQTTTRSWTDGNGNKTPDCDLQNRALQDNRASGGDLCGAWDNQNFGSIVSATTLNPDVLEGWGVRPYDWQFGLSVQHELLPRVSAEVGYSRRSWGNFFYTDNLDVGPEHYDTLTFTAPTHPDLPTSGEQVSYKLIKDSGFGRVRNYYTFASDYGDVTSYWQGVDLTVNARMNNGLTMQGGFSTGGGVRDTCEITAALPETLGEPAGQLVRGQRSRGYWNWRGLANYIVPKIDVQVSAILRSQANTSPGGGRGVQRCVAVGQLQHHQRPGDRGARTSARWQRSEHLGRPHAARGALRRSHQQRRHALREDPALWENPEHRRARPLQHAERQYRNRLPADVRPAEQRRDLVTADADSEPEVRSLQRDDGLLS